ncbi:MAG: isochorismatase family protein, partial [Thermoleophilaceae bacterium]|nr:isochorismatase family protein [Thermoleophilaceae bacterium]
VLVGQVTEQCILYSALDAYVRRLRVTVPRDGVAHIDERLAGAALEMMQRNMDAELTACAECELGGTGEAPP